MTKTPTPTPVRPKTPIFDAMIEEARRSPKDRDIMHEALGRRLGITEEEEQAAQARLDRWLREDAEEEINVDKVNDVGLNGRASRERSRSQGAKR